jgi:hypothetical protein
MKILDPGRNEHANNLSSSSLVNLVCEPGLKSPGCISMTGCIPLCRAPVMRVSLAPRSARGKVPSSALPDTDIPVLQDWSSELQPTQLVVIRA